MDILYKKIHRSDSIKVENLINAVLSKIENKDFFIPIKEEELSELYNNDICVLYGGYDNEKLVAIAKLDLNEKYTKELKDILALQNKRVAELGRYLVLDEYRNKGIMFELEKVLINYARVNNYEYVVATAHPDNIPSNKTIQKAGLKLETTVTLENGFYRNIYVKNIC